MGIEVWIVLLLLASAGSAWAGYTVARGKGPSQKDLDALEAELDEARQQAQSVQANVNEHFEQSAVLFGRLAKDYREFLDHFSSSAQSLGLSEGRARELLEQGFQPLLTHEDEEAEQVAAHQAEAAVVEEVVVEEEVVAEPVVADSETAEPLVTDAEAVASATDEVGQSPAEPPTLESVVEQQTAQVADVVVDMPDDEPEPERKPDDIKQANP